MDQAKRIHRGDQRSPLVFDGLVDPLRLIHLPLNFGSWKGATRRSNLVFSGAQKSRLLRRVAPRNDGICELHLGSDICRAEPAKTRMNTASSGSYNTDRALRHMAGELSNFVLIGQINHLTDNDDTWTRKLLRARGVGDPGWKIYC